VIGDVVVDLDAGGGMEADRVPVNTTLAKLFLSLHFFSHAVGFHASMLHVHNSYREGFLTWRLASIIPK
jgi:hypothetical protein